MHAFYQHSLSLAHRWVRKDFKKELQVAVSFPFRHKLLANKNEHERVPWLFVFLRPPLPSICIWSQFWFKHKAWPLGAVSGLCLFSCWHNTLTLCWLWVLPNSHVSQIPRDSVFIGHQRSYTQMGWQGTAVGIALLLPYMLCFPISHHLQNTSSEVKLVIKNFKMATSKELNKAWSPSEYEALRSCPDHMSGKAALLPISLCKHHHGTGHTAPWGLIFLVGLPH